MCGEHGCYNVQHVLVKHSPWFVDKFGSLSVWNCQGMEKSHHAAKASTQYHSQHGGTKKRVSIVVQQYQFWYRNIQHRYEAKVEKRAREEQRPAPDPTMTSAALRRRDAWWASDAAAACDAWRQVRERVGSQYVSQESEEGSSASASCNEGNPANTGHEYGLFREESCIGGEHLDEQ